jgi:hypothetical protein
MYTCTVVLKTSTHNMKLGGIFLCFTFVDEQEFSKRRNSTDSANYMAVDTLYICTFASTNSNHYKHYQPLISHHLTKNQLKAERQQQKHGY